jgi:hypothetical protein
MAWLVLAGCGGAETEAPPPGPPSCAIPEVGLPDGSCIRPGIPPDGCLEGFVHDGEYGCAPVLPEMPCPIGTMAVPGETECRGIAACGSGKWGDIPIDGTTVYVDASYVAGDGDGSASKPFPTIGQAVVAAPAGALVAIAAGSYNEDVDINKMLRLWGVCPERVEIVGLGSNTTCPPATVCVKTGADGTEFHTLALVGPVSGFTLSGAQNVSLDRVWIHDNDNGGIDAESVLGPTSLTLTESLLEHNVGIGIYVMGADVSVANTVVRDTAPGDTSRQLNGRGIDFENVCWLGADGMVAACDPNAPAHGQVTRSVFERNHDVGILAMTSEVTVAGTVVRDTLPTLNQAPGGAGIMAQPPCIPDGSGMFACDATAPSRMTVRGSFVAHESGSGIVVASSEATIETTVMRDHSPGRGMTIQNACAPQPDGSEVCETHAPSHVTVLSSLLQQNENVGLLVIGSEAIVEDTVIRGTKPDSLGQFGRGIGIQSGCETLASGMLECDPEAGASAVVRRSLVADNHGEGICIIDSDATIEASVVVGTLPRANGVYGDGVAVFSALMPASASLDGTRVEQSSRAGLSSFGSKVSVHMTHIQCAAFDLDGENSGQFQWAFENRGAVSCGCPVADRECKAVSSGLTPPEVAAPGM